jgi:DNA repair protein RAD16
MDHGKCRGCGCASSQHFSYFNKHVLNVIQREGYTGDGRRAMMKLKNEVLDKCLLRRTKESRAADMKLPPRVVTIKPIRLHPREEDFYNALYTQTKSSFDDYVSEGTLLNNYAHIFDLLTKMRQAVDHPYLIVHSKKNHNKIVQGGLAVANGSTDCELCGETPTDRVLSTCCKSAFCRSCVVDMMTLADVVQGSTRCPCCQAPFSIDLNQKIQQVVDNGTLTVNDTVGMPSLKEMRNVASNSILRRINLAEFSTSTKVESLVEELYTMRKERQGSKALVFSQFTSMLDLCRWRLVSDPCLQDLGLGVRIVHGGMNVQSRDEALTAFKEDPSVRVLLMSLKAGGVALNLTVANEAYLLDPWWNPAAEMQAIDRTHRLGQYRPIRAVRFIAEGTVEERVLQLQEKKRLVFDGTIGRDAASLKMLSVNDMKALFT